jgi:FixJ family two-component response regulator
MAGELLQALEIRPDSFGSHLSHIAETPRRSMNETAEAKRPLVSLVDDDESIRESLPDLLIELGFAAKAFSSAEEFLESDCVEGTRCLLVDIVMPGMTGPDLQHELERRCQLIPIIFITSQRDENVRLILLERGAVECLFKPFSETALQEALDAALRTN